MRTLSTRQILLLHTQLIQETGGIDGLRDEDLLESALAAPFQSFGGADVFPSLQQKAARLGFGLGCVSKMRRVQFRADSLAVQG